MGYNYKPLAGPQALYTPQRNFSYITVEDYDDTQRALVRKFSNVLSKPQVASGTPFEVTGPFTDSQDIYFFGTPSPILKKSVSGGASATDIYPSGYSAIRPVLPLVGTADDDMIIVASGIGGLRALHRSGGTWIPRATVPIVPGCGGRSAFLGSEAMLGQSSAGQAQKVSFTGSYGSSWSDLSDGLPDVEITSITGHTGGETFKPKLQGCSLLDAYLGRYWYATYHRGDGWPSMWEYDVDQTCWYFSTMYRAYTWYGFMVTHIFLTNCVEHESTNGVTFDMEVYISSPVGLSSLASDSRVLYTRSGMREDVEEGGYQKNYLYQGPCYSVTKLSGSWTGPGWFKLIYRPFNYDWADEDYLPYSAPWMGFSLLFESGNYWSHRDVIPLYGVPCTFSCGSEGNQVDYMLLGERSYPQFYLTLEQEFEARYPIFPLGSYLGQCTGDGTNPFVDKVWSTDDTASGYVPWHDYEQYDLGAFVIHIIE